MLTLLLLACGTEPSPPPGTPPTGTGLFTRGCPADGHALARVLTDPEERPEGPDALARPGDVLLANGRAAFVIQDPAAPRTYVHYGGVPIDAVPVAGCTQAGPDRFGEMAVLIGQLDLADFAGSTLRMFRGTRAEVVRDGSDGGPAVVDVHGVDATFHLVELELIRDRFLEGRPKTPSVATGLALTLRYTLAPDSNVLGMELRMEGEGDPRGYLAGLLAFPGDTTRTVAWSDESLRVGGIGLGLGAPWFAATSPDASWAVSNPDGTLARTEISGVTALLDVTDVAEPLRPTLAGGPATARWDLAIGAGGSPTATAALLPRLTERFPDPDAVARAVSVAVSGPGEAPVPGARILFEAATPAGAWRELDRAWTGADGTLTVRVVDPGHGLRARVESDDRDVLTPPCTITPNARVCFFSATGAGALEVRADDGGEPLPARVALTRDDGWRTTAWVAPGDAPVNVRPGRYTARVTHGTTHLPDTQVLDVTAGAPTVLATTLPRVVDSRGWLSIDTHVHAEPSADSTVLPADRFRTAAAGGLDVVVSTDHEVIRALGDARADAGLDARVGYALGSEITAAIPEHVNAWPFPEAPDDPRGAYVQWYGMGIGAIYDAARARGAQVVQLNHARVNGSCGLLCLIDWDRIGGEARVATMDDLALPPGTPSFDWGFDAYEVMNGLRSPFLRADDPRHSGAFEDWLAFLNHGHRITAVGVTDVHGEDLPGIPGTWLAVDDDTPGDVAEQALVDAMLGGHAVVTAGAFLDARVDGAGPGETATTDNGRATLSVRVEALPELDVTHVEVLVDCDEVAELPATDPHGAVKLDLEAPLSLARDAYVVVVAYGDGPMPDGLPALETTTEVVPRAFTNAIFVDVDGDGQWTAPGGKTCTGDTRRGQPGLPD